MLIKCIRKWNLNAISFYVSTTKMWFTTLVQTYMQTNRRTEGETEGPIIMTWHISDFRSVNICGLFADFGLCTVLLFQIYFNFLLKLSYPIEKLFFLPVGFELLFLLSDADTLTNWAIECAILLVTRKVFRLDNPILTKNWNIFEIIK